MTTRLTEERLTYWHENARANWIPAEDLRAIIDEIRASRSSSGSGARGRALEAEVAKLTAQRTMTVHRLGGEVEGAPTHAGNFLQRIDALRAIEADSGERVRALAQKCVEDVRAIGQRYRDDWSGFDGRTLKEELIEATWGLDRALSPQGDGTPEPKTKE